MGMASWILVAVFAVGEASCTNAAVDTNSHTQEECDNWVANNMCNDPNEMQFMRANCAQSCGFCNEGSSEEEEESSLFSDMPDVPSMPSMEMAVQPVLACTEDAECETLENCVAGGASTFCSEGYCWSSYADDDACPTMEEGVEPDTSDSLDKNKNEIKQCWQGNLQSKCSITPAGDILQILGGLAVLVLFGIFGGLMDLCLAPKQQVAPKFECPRGCADAFLAILTLVVKVYVVLGLAALSVLPNLIDELLALFFNLGGSFMAGCVVYTLYLPWALSWAPSSSQCWRVVLDEKAERSKDMGGYVKANAGSAFAAVRNAFCLCQAFMPTRFVTIWRCVLALCYTDILTRMLANSWFLLRVTVASLTYKLFTFKGWVEECKHAAVQKKRITDLKYRRYYPDLADEEVDGDKQGKEEAKGLGKKTGGIVTVKPAGESGASSGAAAGAGEAAAAGSCASSLSFGCTFLTSLAMDVPVEFALQFMLVGMAVVHADKVINPANIRDSSSTQSTAASFTGVKP